MIETEVFKELNVFGPNGAPTPDLIGDAPPEETEREPYCCGLFQSRPRSRVSVVSFLLFFIWETFFENLSGHSGSHHVISVTYFSMLDSSLYSSLDFFRIFYGDKLEFNTSLWFIHSLFCSK